MSAAGVAFIGYGIVFLIRNFTGDFLELGTGPRSGREQQGRDQGVRQRPLPLHQPPAHRDCGLHRSRRPFGGLPVVVRGAPWLPVGLGRCRRHAFRPCPPGRAPAHYPWGFDTIGHLGLIYLATGIFVVGALLSLRALSEQDRAAALMETVNTLDTAELEARVKSMYREVAEEPDHEFHFGRGASSPSGSAIRLTTSIRIPAEAIKVVRWWGTSST